MLQTFSSSVNLWPEVLLVERDFQDQAKTHSRPCACGDARREGAYAPPHCARECPAQCTSMSTPRLPDVTKGVILTTSVDHLKHPLLDCIPLWSSSRHTWIGIMAWLHILLHRHRNRFDADLRTESGEQTSILLLSAVRGSLGWRYVWRFDVICTHLDTVLWPVQGLTVRAGMQSATKESSALACASERCLP